MIEYSTDLNKANEGMVDLSEAFKKASANVELVVEPIQEEVSELNTEGLLEEPITLASKLDKKVDTIYTVRVEGLKYGNYCRKTETYADALEIYAKFKKMFHCYNCHVVLESNKNTKEGVVTKTIYKKQIGQEYDVKEQLEMIIFTLDHLDMMKRTYTDTQSDVDKFLSNFYHALELVDSDDLSPEQMKSLFRGVEDRSVARRISKLQLDYLNSIHPNLCTIRGNVNKALDICKKVDHNQNTAKAIKNGEKKNKEILELLDLC